MKIGILTLPLHVNYGGILQAYALQTVLKRMGHDVEIIDFPGHAKRFRAKWFGIMLRKAFSILHEIKYNVFDKQKEKVLMPIINQHISKFINTYIKKSEYYKRLVTISENKYDAIVVGSDQVWRPKFFGEPIEMAYLYFAKDWKIKRISYAASFGTDEWEYTPKETKKCKRLLEMFDAVSVREYTGIHLCKEHFGINASLVLDPTMLLSADDYIQLFINAGTTKSKGTLLTYILDETKEKLQFINHLANEKNLTPFRIISKAGDKNASLDERIHFSVEQWLRGFYDAKFVITDSFHACVFSLLFNKPFIVIGNSNRGLARFSSLLNMFGLNDCYVSDCSEMINNSITWDWVRINKIIEEKRNESIGFIKKYIQ